jgi:hypothetical protein
MKDVKVINDIGLKNYIEIMKDNKCSDTFIIEMLKDIIVTAFNEIKK